MKAEAVRGNIRRVAGTNLRRSRSWILLAVPLILTSGLTLAWRLASPRAIEDSASGFLALYTLSICFLLRWRSALAILFLAASIAFGLEEVNRTKIALTQAPLTALDLKIAFANPLGLWQSLGWPYWTLRLGIACGGLILISCAAVLVRDVRKSCASMEAVKRCARSAVCQAWAVGALIYFVHSLPGLLAVRAVKNGSLWEPVGLAKYSESIGAVPFVLFSSFLETNDGGPYYDTTLQAAPASPAELARASGRYVNIHSPSQSQLPNIIVLMAESTFDPNKAFRLAGRHEVTLFTPRSDTQLLTGLQVNAVGGGSWITEFESIAGIDSRNFGYSGFYTHATLSPYIRRTLVRYLAAKGYDTAAYYPWPGTFYNARRAYGNYGFRHFFDPGDFDLPVATWQSDRSIAAAALSKLKPMRAAPFFAYVVLTENHAPHPCDHFSRSEDFVATFAGVQDFGMNCQLNEYLRRLDSTSEAFDLVATYLRELQQATGRPYVLAIFGDHQPHTFTGTDSAHYSTFDYSPVRTQAGLQETFLHIRSSMAVTLKCCGPAAPPAAIIPSLLSAFAASSLDDIYMPETFYLYQHCGSKPVKGGLTWGVQDDAASALREVNRESRPHPLDSDTRAGTCEDVFRTALAAYHREGIF